MAAWRKSEEKNQMTQSLKGKTALVTGASRGIGRAIAERLAKDGATVALTYNTSKSGANEAVAAIEKAGGIAFALHADLVDPATIPALFEKLDDEFTKRNGSKALDILVNNAGVQFVSPVEEFPVEKWDQIIAINLSSAFHAIRAATPGMKARKWGRIINTASAHSLIASPFKAAYVAAKHGIAGLTKTVGLELATFGVTCNCISPGYVWTPLVERQIPDTMKARNMTEEQVKRDVLLAAQPTKQFVTVDQVAAMAVFLCSEAASQMTGANISMDGGWTAQ